MEFSGKKSGGMIALFTDGLIAEVSFTDVSEFGGTTVTGLLEAAGVNAAANDDELGRICWLGSITVVGKGAACNGSLQSITFTFGTRVFIECAYGGDRGEGT